MSLFTRKKTWDPPGAHKMLNIRDSDLCYKELKGKQNVDLKTGTIFISSIKGEKKLFLMQWL
jgi:hypothetical protein